MKCPQSQSRRHKPRPLLPFPLQDSEGRLTSISQLYEHAAEQPVAHHNVAGRGIMHLHLEMLPQKARHLRNQVTCMIVEYHLTSSARGPSSLSPVIPQEAAALLPPLKNYVPGITFEGTRDVRVVDRAKTLWVAVWLHRLDMAVEGKGMASETLEASQHWQGPPPGVIPDSKDEQPHLSGGCLLRPERESACLRMLTTLPPGTSRSQS